VRHRLTPKQIARTRHYRKLFELALTKSERDAIVETGAEEMGIAPDSLRNRWHHLGMCKRWAFMQPIVRKAVAKYPFTADRVLARRYNVNCSSFQVTRTRLGIPCSLVRRRAALRGEVAIYVRDYADLTAEEVRASIKADGEYPWPFSVRYIEELMHEVVNERAAS